MSWLVDVHTRRFSNGLTAIVQPVPGLPAAAFVSRVGAGFFDEPDAVAGISHVLEHMFFKGTPTRGVGEIARATKSLGGYLNAGTSYDYTVYYTVLVIPSVLIDKASHRLTYTIAQSGNEPKQWTGSCRKLEAAIPRQSEIAAAVDAK